MPTPRMAAQLDWMQQGCFHPEKYQGDERRQYEDEAAKIQRQWDNNPR